jgi:3-hydroxyacyl-[acyl-carrier-protein] dehydratase
VHLDVTLPIIHRELTGGCSARARPTEWRTAGDRTISIAANCRAAGAMTGSGEMTGATLEAIGILEILAALPHRYPFLLVDRIIDIRGDEHGIGIKNVTANEPHFVGHFPNNPVMPGVLVLEGMAQTAGTMCIRAQPGQGKPARVYFLTIDKVKFRKPVVPGDRLEYHMNRIKRRRNMWWFRGEAKVDGELVAEAELGAMVAWD